MDLFEEYFSPAALSAASPLVEPKTTTSVEISSQHLFVFHDFPSGEPGVRETTRQQWETFKPLIKQIYIDESKPFPYLAKILRDEYDFEPTKRQFSRQVEKWGFRKNVSRNERRRILPSLLRSVNDPVPQLADRRLKAGKLRNWRRRYREELSERSSILLPEYDNSVGYSPRELAPAFAPEFPIAKTELSITEAEGHQVSDLRELLPAPGVPVNLNNNMEWSGHSPEDFTLMDICQDALPFNWSKVDVPGSPGLSRLFARLKIESESGIPTLSLEKTESDGPSCLSRTEIQEVFHPNQKAPGEHFCQAHSSRGQKYFGPREEQSKLRRPQYPWRNIEVVFCGYSPSPLTEMYVFPPSPPRKYSCKRHCSATPAWINFERQERELQVKVAKLKKQFPDNNPAVMAGMEELADVLFNIRKYKEAGFVYEKLVDIYQRTAGHNHIRTWKGIYNVIISLKGQGYYTKAKHLTDNLRGTISKSVSPHHPLAIRVSKLAAWLAEVLGEPKDSESIRRQVLQMSLVSYGPRHPNTMQALSHLGHTTSLMSKKEGEMLLRIAVQLSLQDPHQGDHINCAMMNNLANALNFNGSYNESYQLTSFALERFTPLLASQHISLVYDLQEQRAQSLLEVGRLVESEKHFRDLVVCYATSNIERLNSELSNAWCGLANVLAQLGNRAEATGWYEKYIRMRISSDRGVDNALVITFYRLLACYQEQGRFDDTLTAYLQVIEKLRKYHRDTESRLIAQMESEMKWIEDFAAQSSSDSSVSEWEVSEYETDVNNTDDDDEANDADEVMDGGQDVVVEEIEKQMVEEGEEESELEREDWSSFLCLDVPTP